jgi:hypothetical protein
MPEIIDQANERGTPAGNDHPNVRINHAAVSATHCRDCGEEIRLGAGTGGGLPALR